MLTKKLLNFTEKLKTVSETYRLFLPFAVTVIQNREVKRD